MTQSRKTNHRQKRRNIPRPHHHSRNPKLIGNPLTEVPMSVRNQAPDAAVRHQLRHALPEGLDAAPVQQGYELQNADAADIGLGKTVGDGPEREGGMVGRVERVEMGVEDCDGEAFRMEDLGEVKHGVYVALERQRKKD